MLACDKVSAILLRSIRLLHAKFAPSQSCWTLRAQLFDSPSQSRSIVSMLSASSAHLEGIQIPKDAEPSQVKDVSVMATDSRPRILVVIGPTGSGKSQFAVDVAKLHGNAEILNCDVIQMYRGLDVASAKASKDERGGIPHHLMSFLQPQETFTVRDFKHMADEAIKDIAGRGKLPIIVGGTMYYVQSLIRDSLLEEDEAALAESKSVDPTSLTNTTAAASTNVPVPAPVYTPYDRLCRVDPVMARRLHPNDHRKIQRALEVRNCTIV
jgi:tRNA A37 N6-isopentenylltransferase MiaA